MMANLYFPKGKEAKKLAALFDKGELNRIRKGIYIDSFDQEEIRKTLETKWYEIACHLFEAPLAVARTAAEFKPADGRLYFVSDVLSGRRTIKIGHLSFDIGPGNITDGVEQVTLEMKRSNLPRLCLENLSSSRGDPKSKRTLDSNWVEQKLVMTVQKRGEEALNSLRDDARRLSSILGLEKEFEKLSKIISAILTTHPIEGVLQTKIGIAQAKGEPFDPARLEKFRAFSRYICQLNLTVNSYQYTRLGWRNLSFFESYFSNYIEGTEFTLEEAERIVFERKPIYERHADSHDILAHMEICSEMSEMKRVPHTASEFIDLLKLRHDLLMAERPDKRPGQFKEKANKAGSTEFVLPEYLEGSLVQGFGIYKGLPEGIHRALFIHFLISECHPFDDGNGRVSRIMMNAELVSQDQFKIIIPTVHRESYVGSLRNASRQDRFRTSVKVLHQMQCYTASLPWEDYGEIREALEQHYANREPDVGVTVFNSVISRMGDEYPAG